MSVVLINMVAVA